MAPWEGGFPEYVPVAERRRRAARRAAELTKAGRRLAPVVVSGRKIAHTFWGSAWCDHLERYSDFASRLPRGRTYVRNGSVMHLDIAPGVITALVSGSDIYEVEVSIDALAKPRWKKLARECGGRIGSVVELLSGNLSDDVMQVLTQRDGGMFPAPKQIHLHCSCPDVALLCKHVAAVLYGVGSRLDSEPELLFTLRQVDQAELVAAGSGAGLKRRSKAARVLDDSSLMDVFGIELDVAGEGLGSGAKEKAGAKKKAGARKKPVGRG